MAAKKERRVEDDTLRKRSQVGEIWHRLKKNKLAMVSLGFIVLLILAVSLADVIAPYPYDQIDLANALQKPCLKHLMGTDDFGRDLFSRILYGGRISLLVAFCTVLISIVIAAILGAAAGYFGGWFDSAIMRVVDVFMAIPGMLLAISIAAALGRGIVNTALAITISNIPGLTRVVRSSVLLLRDQEYIQAATAFGGSNGHIIRRHIIPNTLAPLIVQASLKFGDAILSIARHELYRTGHRAADP